MPKDRKETERTNGDEGTKRVSVTPELAEQWLTLNEANRPLRRSSVSRMATDMASGLWNQANPQPLIFDTTGALIDGQHRLTAQVQAGVTLWWSVAHDVPRQTQLVIDDHIPRQVHDFAKWEMPGHAISSRHVACARVMIQSLPGSKAVAPSRTFLYRFMRTHLTAIDFALVAFTKRIAHITTANTAGVLARAFYTQDKVRLQRFAEVLETGQTINATEAAAVTVSRWLLERSRKKGREEYSKIERGLQAFLDEEPLAKLIAAPRELFLLPEEQPAGRDEELSAKATADEGDEQGVLVSTV